MKRLFASALLGVLLLLTTGCNEIYYQKIDELQGRVDDLNLLCDQINSSLASLRELVTVIESQDMVTGITEIRSGSTVTGYRINFVQHESITITNGQDGKKPLVSSQRDSEDGNYYWTVQYGDGPSQWLLAPDGSKMLSIGVLPFITIRDGYFYYTIDGQQWTQLGKADGQNGDQMFASIDTSHENYVTFTLTTGEVFKIPTYNTYLKLKTEFDKTNENVTAQIELVRASIDRLTYITSVAPVLSGKDTVGLSVTLSNGKSFRIHDWTASVSPAIYIKKDTDGKLYWAYTIGSSEEHWVLSPDGAKISASSDAVDVPLVSVTHDKDGQYYWTVTSQGKTELLRFPVDSTWTPHVIDTVSSAFSSVKTYADSLVVVLKDGKTRFNLPMQYTVTLTDADGNPFSGTVTLAAGKETTLEYVANGPSASLSLLTQGGVTATDETLNGRNYIRITAPASYGNATAKVIACFSFETKTNTVTVIKTITVKKK